MVTGHAGDVEKLHGKSPSPEVKMVLAMVVRSRAMPFRFFVLGSDPNRSTSGG
jgi:hypothetical protein